jgi:hypothetical protein
VQLLKYQEKIGGGKIWKIFDMILDAALKMGKDLLQPSFEEMDRQPPVLENGKVKVHPSVRTVMQKFGEGGRKSAA